MADLRDIKLRARRDLHREAAIPAYYIPAVGSPPQLVSVRIHNRVVVAGDNGDSELVVRRDVAPRIVFLVEEVAVPRINGVVSVATGEAYRIQDSAIPDLITVTAAVVPMSAQSTTGLPVPIR